MSSSGTSYSLSSQLLGAAVFALLGLAALAGYILFALPPQRQHHEPFRPSYSEQPLLAALSSNGISQRLQQIERAGEAPGERAIGRLSGSPGFYRAEALILKAFAEAGLEVHTQRLPVTVPVTEYCEILDEQGQPLPGVTLYPFTPCGLIPTALPTNGIQGELVLAEQAALRFLVGHRPEESIVLTYLGSGSWRSLAAAGVKAVIVMEDELRQALAADPDKPMAWNSMVVGSEVAYPRFLARGPLADFAGKKLTLRCKVTWQEKTVRNLLGVLKGKSTAEDYAEKSRKDGPRGRGPSPKKTIAPGFASGGTAASPSADVFSAQSAEEALILSAYYDSNSLVPELAPGAEQAIPLAVLLELVRALAPYAGQLRRDVIFIATSGHAQSFAGMCRLLEPIETFTLGTADRRAFEDRIREELILSGHARQGLKLVNDDERWGEAAVATFAERWGKEDASFRKWFEQRLITVLGELNLEFKEQVLARQLAYLRADSPVYRDGFDFAKATDAERKAAENRHPLLAELLAAKALDNRSGNTMTQPLPQLVLRAEFGEWQIRSRLREMLQRIESYHQRQIKELQDCVAIRDLFAPYRETMTLNLELNSGGSRAYKDISVLTGLPGVGSIAEPQVSEIAQLLKAKIPVAGRRSAFEVIQWGALDASGTTERPNLHGAGNISLESELWTLSGKLGFSLLNYSFVPEKLCTPEDIFAGINPDVVREQVPVLARAILAMADGCVAFKAITADRKKRIVSLHGKVYGTAGAGTVVPTHPMGINTVVRVYTPSATMLQMIDSAYRGLRVYPILMTNPYGEYRQRFNFNLVSSAGWARAIALDAARFDEQGRVRFFKNASPSVQAIYPNESFSTAEIMAANRAPAKPISAGVFRCAPVELYELNNPMTMQAFKGVQFLNSPGLAGPANYRFAETMFFLDPDWRFFVALLDGATGNKEILANRAFLLNVDPQKPITAQEPEIYGQGYLAADNPNIINADHETAESMLRTNAKRLELQKRYGIADELVLAFHERGKELLELSRQYRKALDPLGEWLSAAKSLSYAMNNHPVIRQKIFHAVIGILWYLGLLVPFVFFFEKLVFGFTDIRKQLLSSGIIFLVVFLLLRFFHPAFQMVRAPLMILLGFIILLLTLLVTLMVSGKFQQNIKELRSKEGRIEGADINRGGVIGTAFMLGLNNMRRRKVRTGLTSLTLILLTFVIICFTSISTDLVDVEYPTGKSAWNGIFFRKPNYLGISGSEQAGLQELYGQQYPLGIISWLTTSLGAGPIALKNAEIIIDREYAAGANQIRKRAVVNASVTLGGNEPQFSGVDRLLLTRRGWFPREPSLRQELEAALKSGYREQRLVILPESVARELEITPEAVDAAELEVTIRGNSYIVQGIIDELSLDNVTGLDGRGILPYDINSIQALGSSSAGILVPEDVKRLNAAQVILVNRHPPFKPGAEETRTVACGILFPKEPHAIIKDGPTLPAVGYKDQRRLVTEFLERSGERAYYAIDGVAYYGARLRARTVEGLLEMLVPILIAALTVFSTMRGSVYERRDEIYVYNAVGIAPNHVFFMFMAEACVYAVVGAMLGYLLSQSTGRVLMALNLTGGLNMNYSSIETIYASLTIMGAVMLSTLIPAREAAHLASPAEERKWSVPVAEGDVMSFNLPFTFTTHDRIAVISYFRRWLDANGEGSAGPFFCAAPQPKLRQAPGEERSGGLLPGITTTIWLKPFDLGVSQRLDIYLPIDPQTGEYIANIRLRRLSGTAAAWARTVKPFLGVLRKQFLNWRAATPAERTEMFTEACTLLGKCRIESAGTT